MSCKYTLLMLESLFYSVTLIVSEALLAPIKILKEQVRASLALPELVINILTLHVTENPSCAHRWSFIPKLKIFGMSTMNEEGMEQTEDHKIQAWLHSQTHTYLSSVVNSIVS